MNRRWARALAATAGLATIVALVPAGGGGQRALAAAPRPNIVLIITDDQPVGTLGRMPVVRNQIAAKGITFTNGFVSDSLCCPSRTSILRGQYSHTTGVYDVRGPYGGWGRVHRTHLEDSTLATWLDALGYRTALIGKYLNAYSDLSFVPPGWDYWRGAVGNYYDYSVSENGAVRKYGSKPAAYKTDVLSAYANSFIRSTPAGAPLFLDLTPFAPHDPFTPAPRFRGDPRCDRASYQHWAAFNESNVKDKPSYIRRHPRLTPSQARLIGVRRARLQCRDLLSVDAMVRTVIKALTDTGRIANTLIVFTSDNGLANGTHRWNAKKVPYERSIRVPFLVRYDPLTDPGTTEDRMVLNIDLAPTIMDLLNAPVRPGCPKPHYGPCSGAFDGRSMVPLLRGAGVPWRASFLIEHFETRVRGQAGQVPAFCGIRSTRYKLVRYTDGEQEFYDLARDPGEKVNLLFRGLSPSQTTTYRRLRARLFGKNGLCHPAPPKYRLP